MSNKNFEFQKFSILTKNLFLPYWQKFYNSSTCYSQKIESFFFKQSKKKVILALSSKYSQILILPISINHTAIISHVDKSKCLIWSFCIYAWILHFIPCKAASECISIFWPKYLLPLYITWKKIQNPYYWQSLTPFISISPCFSLAPVTWPFHVP